LRVVNVAFNPIPIVSTTMLRGCCAVGDGS
jgi:hypothetical protein